MNKIVNKLIAILVCILTLLLLPILLMLLSPTIRNILISKNIDITNHLFFGIILICVFLILFLPFALDLIKLNSSEGDLSSTSSSEQKSTTRRSIALGLVFIYVVMHLYSIFYGAKDIPNEFITLVATVVGYYFGRSTALDVPNNVRKENKDDNNQK